MLKNNLLELGTSLTSLTLEGGEEAGNANEPAVLSCGGILLRRPETVPTLEHWRPTIHTHGRECPIKIFSIEPKSSESLFRDFLIRESLN